MNKKNAASAATAKPCPRFVMMDDEHVSDMIATLTAVQQAFSDYEASLIDSHSFNGRLDASAGDLKQIGEVTAAAHGLAGVIDDLLHAFDQSQASPALTADPEAAAEAKLRNRDYILTKRSRMPTAYLIFNDGQQFSTNADPEDLAALLTRFESVDL